MLLFTLLLIIVGMVNASWVKEMENPNLYEGDMVLTPQQISDARTGQLTYATTNHHHWPKFIYYDWESKLANNRGILAAIAEYEKFTCLRFKKRTNERDYMYFYVGNGCNSGVGYRRNSGKHSISIGRGCAGKGTVIHEIGHRLGIYHEQSRPDRDNYITVAYENIQDRYKFAFDKQAAKNIDYYGTAYDYRSIMHYTDWSFSKNGKPTILTKDPKMQKVIGNRSGFSDIDKIQINRMYKCGTTTEPPTQPPTNPPTHPPTHPPTPSTTFSLQHSAGRCLSVNSVNRLFLTSSCSTKFFLTSSGELQLAGTSKCAYTQWNKYNAIVYFKDHCGQTFQRTSFENGGYFSLKHVPSGFCLHPLRGSTRPAEGTMMVIYGGCSERRLKFKSI